MDLKDLQEKETVRTLISKAGNGLDNPMLVAIAEVAPSPTAADHYVTQTLGWSNEVGRVIRDMVRLHQKSTPEVWKSLVDSEFRPADVLFKFNEMHNGLWFETSMNWAGEIANRADWPLFLREFKPQTTSTTRCTIIYDGCGDAPAERVSEPDLYDPAFSLNGAFRRYPHHFDKLELSVLVAVNQPTCWRIAHTDDSKNSFEVCGKSLVLLPETLSLKSGRRVFPEFWKIIRIKKCWPKEVAEEIIIAVRRDFRANKRRILGNLMYGKDVALPGPFRKAMLEINYSVWSDFSLELNMSGNLPISIPCDEGELSPNVSCINPSEMAKAVKDLGDTVLQILYPLSLHEVLGRELIENPPKTLAELLVKK